MFGHTQILHTKPCYFAVDFERRMDNRISLRGRGRGEIWEFPKGEEGERGWLNNFENKKDNKVSKQR